MSMMRLDFPAWDIRILDFSGESRINWSNPEIRVIRLTIAGSNLRLAGVGGEERVRQSALVTFVTRRDTGKIFLFEIGCNPLKSPDSKK
jgi:hypothetical protein